ncbi:hypothetical protein BT93_C1024 [Corymbia citriodora subsp. variegata]|nr:hypothetical protein BT93_C1024 [Corymbia citriodora subsp. variegata]
MSTCALATTFLLLAAAAAATSGTREDLRAAMSMVSQAKVWVDHRFMSLDHNDGEEMSNNTNVMRHRLSLSDCSKLYGNSESRLMQVLDGQDYTAEDARTWLSGASANHRTCLDGLGEEGRAALDGLSGGLLVNLTLSLGHALALYGRERGVRRGTSPSLGLDPNGGLLASWNAATSKADFIVAKDGSGTHKTINDAVVALARMGENRPERAVIYVKSGVYDEKVEIGRDVKNVMFVGDGMDQTVVTGSRNVPDGSSTLTSATFAVSGDGFWARDMTFENTAGPQKHQAVALMVSSDQSVFYRCSFKAYQDTLFTHSLRQFYRDCHVYGTIDFIFGDAAVIFQNCDIFVRRPMDHQANMVTAQGRDDKSENTGILIHGSRIAPAPDFAPVKDSFRSYLGRPWKTYSRTVIMKTDIDGLIDPKGWDEWRGKFALNTLFYGEYMNSGHGASTERRVNWPGFHILKSPEEVGPFSVRRFIQGDLWIPRTGVPFSLDI